MGGRFQTNSQGLGDIPVKANYVFHRLDNDWGSHEIIGTLGLSFPTGSINEKDVLPTSAGVAVQLPYPMQLGSGTYDPMLGFTYLGVSPGAWSWGAQVSSILRLHDNDNDYRLGHEVGAKRGKA